MLNQYYRQQEGHLTTEEEVKFFKELDKTEYASTEYFKMRNRFLMCNQGLVLKQAHKYNKSTMTDFGELVAEGNLGMLIAFEKFDPSKGFKFSTYATYWILQKILRYIEEQESVLSGLRVFANTAQRYLDFESEYISLHGKKPTANEVSTALNVSLAKVSSIRAYIVGTYFTKSIESTEEFYDEENLKDARSYLTIDEALSNAAVVEQLLTNNELTTRESSLIKDYFGINPTGSDSTLEELGQKEGVSRQRIEQVIKRALNKLADTEISKEIKELYFEGEK